MDKEIEVGPIERLAYLGLVDRQNGINRLQAELRADGAALFRHTERVAGLEPGAIGTTAVMLVDGKRVVVRPVPTATVVGDPAAEDLAAAGTPAAGPTHRARHRRSTADEDAATAPAEPEAGS